MSNYIEIKGARVHNLKSIDLKIPRDKFIVVTGLSGSGKSSLAFDTLYAEGQRRYVESLSSYARQFLGRMDKPEVDYIHGIPPAVAIEQKVSTRNPRSTVGTSTEIYDYLKLLYSRIGKTYSPISGREVKRHQTEDVVSFIFSIPSDQYVVICSPLYFPENKNFIEHLTAIARQGFARIKIGEEFFRIKDLIKNELESSLIKNAFLVIDRFKVNNEDKDLISRAADSVQTAFFEGNGVCIVDVNNKAEEFSNKFEADGILFEEPTVHTFSFNSPLGACPKCEGFGKVIGIDEDLVVPNKSLSIYEDAIACWKGDKMQKWKMELISNADKFDFPIHKPYFELSEENKSLLWTGNDYFYGLNDFFEYLESKQYKVQFRVMLSRYRGKAVCPLCKGSRLKKEAGYVKIGGKSIQDLVEIPINELINFFNNLELSPYEGKVAQRLLPDIKNRLNFLINVGLGYLTLNRLSNTLSGGELQRINLATALGSSLVGSLYILDEPSIGLHSRDTHLLIKVLKQLRDIGNTVIVVEHDEDIIKSADQIIDIGPNAGRNGGELVFHGDQSDLLKSDTLTAQYISENRIIPVPQIRRKWNNFIEIKGARENNLKNIDVKIPLNIMTVITGVSGSGKSTLVKSILVPALRKHYGDHCDKTGDFFSLRGDLHLLKKVEIVDQNPIGKSSRSNPVTYIKAWDDIRRLFAEQQLSIYNGFKASHFSFNVPGGRCEHCQGEGIIKVEMQFMADVNLQCEHCKGRRFKDEILEIKYKEKNIYDVLEMTVNEAIEFFSKEHSNVGKKIVSKLQCLVDTGLGYVKLGQASSTLSGGESQRIKLGYFLSKESPEPTIFIFDEPTTGLHFHDIHKLMNSFNSLLSRGHTVLIIEHNLDIIKNADHIIDLGPEGGINGGYIVFEGKPEDLVNCEESYTGKYLANKL